MVMNDHYICDADNNNKKQTIIIKSGRLILLKKGMFGVIGTFKERVRPGIEIQSITLQRVLPYII
jgi:hypothetical protein